MEIQSEYEGKCKLKILFKNKIHLEIEMIDIGRHSSLKSRFAPKI